MAGESLEHIVPAPFPSTWEWEGTFVSQIQNIMSEYSSHREQVCSIVNNIHPTANKDIINPFGRTSSVSKSAAGEVKAKVSPGRMEVCKIEGIRHPVHTSASIRQMPWGSTLNEGCPPPNICPWEGTGSEIVVSRQPEKKLYQCMVCKVAYTDMYKLGKHTFAHMEDIQYKCSMCSKVFTELSSLNDHKHIHYKERPFYCEICKKGFTQKGGLTMHLRSTRHKQKAAEYQKV